MAVSAIVAVSAGVFAYHRLVNMSDDIFSANVEALVELESVITCDSGRCG